jgi:hypothetical protein
VIEYFRRLWRGELPLSRVFWTDMLIVGTLVNVAMLLASMLLFAAGVPAAIAVAVHFLPVPYNILLFTGVWRSAACNASQWAGPAQIGAAVWLIAAIVI